MIKRLLKIGSSVALTIPQEAVEHLRLKPGDKVEVYSDGTSLKIVPMGKKKKLTAGMMFEETVSQATPLKFRPAKNKAGLKDLKFSLHRPDIDVVALLREDRDAR